MAAAIVAHKRVHLVDDHGTQLSKQAPGRHLGAHHHDFERLGRGEQDIGRLGDKAFASSSPDIAVPLERPATEQVRVASEPMLLIVQQGANRGHVDHRDRRPVLAVHEREQRKHGCLGLATGRGGQDDAVGPGQNGADALLLDRTQLAKAQGVDDLILQRRTERVEPAAHERSASTAAPTSAPRSSPRSSSTSSTVRVTPASARSSAVISLACTTNL